MNRKNMDMENRNTTTSITHQLAALFMMFERNTVAAGGEDVETRMRLSPAEEHEKKQIVEQRMKKFIPAPGDLVRYFSNELSPAELFRYFVVARLREPFLRHCERSRRLRAETLPMYRAWRAEVEKLLYEKNEESSSSTSNVYGKLEAAAIAFSFSEQSAELRKEFLAALAPFAARLVLREDITSRTEPDDEPADVATEEQRPSAPSSRIRGEEDDEQQARVAQTSFLRFMSEGLHRVRIFGMHDLVHTGEFVATAWKQAFDDEDGREAWLRRVLAEQRGGLGGIVTSTSTTAGDEAQDQDSSAAARLTRMIVVGTVLCIFVLVGAAGGILLACSNCKKTESNLGQDPNAPDADGDVERHLLQAQERNGVAAEGGSWSGWRAEAKVRGV
eukprot:g20320.t1